MGSQTGGPWVKLHEVGAVGWGQAGEAQTLGMGQGFESGSGVREWVRGSRGLCTHLSPPGLSFPVCGCFCP